MRGQIGATLMVAGLAVALTACRPEEASSTPETAAVENTLLTATSQPTPENPVPAVDSLDAQTRSTDGMVMVFVPGAEFIMGSEEDEVDFALALCQEYGANCRRSYFQGEGPPHEVVLDDYWIDQTEVANRQFEACVEAGACEPSACAGADDLPVACVTWQQAADYCLWAGGRLPTEAEWEYAARGPDRWRYPWGDDFDGSKLNYCDTNCDRSKADDAFDDGYTESAPVGSYPAGASWVGALDMAGNVWEWTGDWLGDYPESQAINPTGPETGGRKILRGGSWNASPDHTRSAVRTFAGPSETIEHAGFRCAALGP